MNISSFISQSSCGNLTAMLVLFTLFGVSLAQTYYYNASFDPSNTSEITINVQSSNYGSHYVKVTPYNNPCNNPKITVTFEQIDYDQSHEKLFVYSSSGSLIQQCSATRSCNTFETCVSDYSLSTSSIAANNIRTITYLYISSNVHALCSSHSYRINAKVKLMCDSSSATPSPTSTPTSPTQIPTMNPTPSPTFSPTKQATARYNINVDPTSSTAASASITSVTSGDFHVNFIPQNADCLNPVISFKYKPIDNDQSGEHLKIFDYNQSMSTIATCQVTSNNCHRYENCINDYQIPTNISMDESYKIIVRVSSKTNALCSHSYRIDAVLSLSCNGQSVEDGDEDEENDNGWLILFIICPCCLLIGVWCNRCKRRRRLRGVARNRIPSVPQPVGNNHIMLHRIANPVQVNLQSVPKCDRKGPGFVSANSFVARQTNEGKNNGERLPNYNEMQVMQPGAYQPGQHQEQNPPPPAYSNNIRMIVQPPMPPVYHEPHVNEVSEWFNQNVIMNRKDMDKYCKLLIANGFDSKISLKYITEQQLKVIGITKIGHINVILAAIKNIK